jgi:CRISPR/Cas system-associated endonuclease Cas1
MKLIHKIWESKTTRFSREPSDLMNYLVSADYSLASDAISDADLNAQQPNA